MSLPSDYVQVILATRPRDSIDSDTFRREVVPFRLSPGQGQVLVQVQYLSIDPGTRMWLNATLNYGVMISPGEVMQSFGIGIVVESGEGSTLTKGDLVSGRHDWAEYCVCDAKGLQKLHVTEGIRILDYMGPMGHIGLTAFLGLFEIGQLQSGDTLVVSGAAGAVGWLVCQIGKERGAKVFGIAGSDLKCAQLEKEIGVDKAFNYKRPTFHQDYSDVVKTFDVFFDNVGGDILDFALTKMNMHARVVICGAISEYNSVEPTPLKNCGQLLMKRAKMQGFIIGDHSDRFAQAQNYLGKLVRSGALSQKYHILEGLDAAPKALNMSFNGENNGKLIIKVADV